ncbi:ligase-associated DNA damage response DEXH box helicase [Hydrotalea sp.]|uniref:ligase-associated DNA damage response DEXH box helicase n=1 Tax=Hydrotalea sp. TaxID=2881279 RepID=UPI002639F0F0|nr:ligase-associated DNA damage response DEXH box helicase [Hydrotalea sp.]
MHIKNTIGYTLVAQYFKSNHQKPFTFQQMAWEAICKGESGLVNAPTGMGKTFAIFLGAIIQFVNQHPDDFHTKNNNELQLLWITPLKALVKDLARAMENTLEALQIPWQVGIRTGDTTTQERLQQKKQLPEILLITPESIHLLLSHAQHTQYFKSLQIITVDEWHELLGNKRGVQVELALSRLVALSYMQSNNHLTKNLSIWGISATIGNLEEAKNVLLQPLKQAGIIIQAQQTKKIHIHAIIPDEVERYPWAGHLGLKLVHKIIPIIEQSNSTLIFINTRGMTEIWYQAILETAPHLSGAIAIHHGSIEKELRAWVEEALHQQKLKAVVCTASLDLGVDFKPVDTVIQIGSPKGIARFMQRAGRSGHQPGATAHIYFLPAHSLELAELAALRQCIHKNILETKPPLQLCYDVLVQYLCTIAIGAGFYSNELFNEIKKTYCYQQLSIDEWNNILLYLTNGGNAFHEYDAFKKLEQEEDGRYVIKNRKIAMQHRMHIGTIVSDAMLKVKWMHGSYLGVIEEWFINRLKIGDSFVLAGKNVMLAMIKDMTVWVKKSTATNTIIPSWMGGRMSLSANLGEQLRQTCSVALAGNSEEMKALLPLFELQQHLSVIPKIQEILVELIQEKKGFHILVYPFEGRLVHEAMSALMAYRLSKIKPISFSIAMNDYGFELFCDEPIELTEHTFKALFSTNHLLIDLQKSVNASEMAAGAFRDIAVIGGLIFQGYPGQNKKTKHLQASASLLFKVLNEYDTHNVLLQQAYKEVFEKQMEEVRLRMALQRIQQSRIIITNPKQFTPFSFPIIAGGLNRNHLSSEKLEDRIKKIQQQLLQ